MPIIYCFDVDGTICSGVDDSDYYAAMPNLQVIAELNRLFDRGNIIKIMTGRGSVSNKDYTDLTKRQLEEWGVKYHELIMNTKPHADLFVDDRAISIDAWIQQIPAIRGVVAGSFDLIHPGYVKMLAEAKRVCTHLTVALHSDPSIDRPGKLKPVLSIQERSTILAAIRYVDEIVPYDSEEDLYRLLQDNDFDVRFLGDDYKGKAYTGADLDMRIHWIDRSHEYSTSKMKRKIHETVLDQDARWLLEA